MKNFYVALKIVVLLLTLSNLGKVQGQGSGITSSSSVSVPSSTASASSTPATSNSNTPSQTSPSVGTSSTVPTTNTPSSTSPRTDCNSHGTFNDPCSCDLMWTGTYCDYKKLIIGKSEPITIPDNTVQTFFVSAGADGISISVETTSGEPIITVEKVNPPPNPQVIDAQAQDISFAEGDYYITISTQGKGSVALDITIQAVPSAGTSLSAMLGTSYYHWVEEGSYKYFEFTNFPSNQDPRFVLTQISGSAGIFAVGTSENPIASETLTQFKRAPGDQQSFTVSVCFANTGPYYVGVLGGTGGSGFELEANSVIRPILPSDTDLTITDIQTDKATISWTPGTSDYGYAIFWDLASTGNNLDTPCDFVSVPIDSRTQFITTSSSTTISGLQPNTDYTVNVLVKDVNSASTNSYTSRSLRTTSLIQSSDQTGLGLGAIIAIIIVAVIVVVFILFMTILWWTKYREKSAGGFKDTELDYMFVETKGDA